MHLVPLLLLLLAAGPSTEHRPGTARVRAPNTLFIPSTGELIFSNTAAANVVVYGAQWVTAVPGMDGGNLSVSLNVNGAPVCTVTVACSAPENTVSSQACGPANDGLVVSQGSVISVTVDRTGCAVTSPSGHVTYSVAR